ncbi:MAG: ROK family protein, partial [Miltoncostaeaceae bacterium]
MILGGVEAGGTKFICLVGDDDGRIIARRRLPTRGPATTLAEVIATLRDAAAAEGPLAAIGVGAFGPVDLRPGPTQGRLLSTPKAGWSGADLVGPLRDAFGVPVAIDTDVTAAALAEGRWGAARGLRDHAYMTVGTGIGVGLIANGRPVRGLVHPEAGHMHVPRMPGDRFPGICPFHGDCLEGMAAGPAMAARWGMPAEELTGQARERAIDMEAGYLAAGVRTLIYVAAPGRVIIGGGVAALPGLLERVRAHLARNLGDYPGLPEHADPGFVRPPGLGDLAGPKGTLLLAASAVAQEAPVP